MSDLKVVDEIHSWRRSPEHRPVVRALPGREGFEVDLGDGFVMRIEDDRELVLEPIALEHIEIRRPPGAAERAAWG